MNTSLLTNRYWKNTRLKINIRKILITKKRKPTCDAMVTLGAGILGFSLKGDLSQLPNNVSTVSLSLTDGDQRYLTFRDS